MIHIKFNGAGGHYSYLVGIASILQKYFDLSDVIFSGYSAGCVPAVMCCLNLNIEKEFKKINIKTLDEINNMKTKAFFNFIPVLKKNLLLRFNEISLNLYLNANNKMYCNLTQIPSMKTHIYNEYYSNEDLINCLMASGHIPIYNNSLFYKFRNQYYIDGGLNRDHYNDLDYIQIIISTNMYRNNLLSTQYFISSDVNYSIYLYNLGRLDILNNLDYYKQYLKTKL